MDTRTDTEKEMKAGTRITIERRAIYAGNSSSERAYDREVVEVRQLEGQNAAIVTLKDKGGKLTRFRKEGNFLHVRHPRAAKYEIVG